MGARNSSSSGVSTVTDSMRIEGSTVAASAAHHACESPADASGSDGVANLQTRRDRSAGHPGWGPRARVTCGPPRTNPTCVPTKSKGSCTVAVCPQKGLDVAGALAAQVAAAGDEVVATVVISAATRLPAWARSRADSDRAVHRILDRPLRISRGRPDWTWSSMCALRFARHGSEAPRPVPLHQDSPRRIKAGVDFTAAQPSTPPPAWPFDTRREAR